MTEKSASADTAYPGPISSSAVKARRKGTVLNRGYGLFLLPGFILFFFVIILPFGVNVFVSFTRWQGIGAPVWIGLANYQKAMADTTFWAAFKNNLILILAITVIPTLIGLLLSSLLFDFIARRFGRGIANFFRGGFYLPQILPVAIAGVVWGWLLQPDGAVNYVLNAVGLHGLTNNWLGNESTALPTVMMIMIWFQIGYPLVIFMAALQRIDPELIEAAAIDGATHLQGFFSITVHLIRPEIAVVILTTTIYTLKIFGQIYVLTRGGPGTATMVPAYFAYQNFFEKFNVGYGATISTIMAFIILLLTAGFLFVQAGQEARQNF